MSQGIVSPEGETMPRPEHIMNDLTETEPFGWEINNQNNGTIAVATANAGSEQSRSVESADSRKPNTATSFKVKNQNQDMAAKVNLSVPHNDASTEHGITVVGLRYEEEKPEIVCHD